MAVTSLSEHEQELVSQLRAEVSSIVAQHACLKQFCNDHTYVRYLRARGWHLQKAAKMLKATLEWRLQYKPHLIKWEEVQLESSSGKLWVYHVQDKAGRPIVIMRPRNQNTKDVEGQIRHLIYTLEVASRLADKNGVGKFTWLLDFNGYSMFNAPPLKVSLHCNSILANHYPERLGLACCYHSPTLFSMTWKAVQPFLDPVTNEKLVFVNKGAHEQEQMALRFDLEQMEQCMGGKLPGYVYDHDKFGAKVVMEHDREVAAEVECGCLQMTAGTATGDHHLVAETAIQGITEGAEQLRVAAS